MTYTQDGDRVTLEMTRDDFDRLMVMLGFALGGTMRLDNAVQFWGVLRFCNEINNGNPNFTPYEIAAEQDWFPPGVKARGRPPKKKAKRS